MTEQTQVNYLVIKHLSMEGDRVSYVGCKAELDELLEGWGSDALDVRIFEVSKELKVKVVVV
jgi:hypothetical protein